jgi:hypothetical protein
LLLSAGEDGRPLTALVVKTDFGERLFSPDLRVRRCAVAAISMMPM